MLWYGQRANNGAGAETTEQGPVSARTKLELIARDERQQRP